MASEPERQSIYHARAALYDQIYHLKNYPAEAARARELLAAAGVADGVRIVEAACGTGKLLEQLKRWYRIAGFDLADEMLAIARGRLPDADLFRADMAAFTLDEQADALLCVFSSIAYLTTEEQLASAARSFSNALVPGGVLLIEPFVDPAAFEDGRPHLDTFEDDDTRLSRTIVTRRLDEIAVLDFHWLVARRGEPVEHFVERHELRLWSRDQLTEAIETAGFDVEWITPGLIPDRALLLATKR
jgi:SAM-dependent methyltransferase